LRMIFFSRPRRISVWRLRSWASSTCTLYRILRDSCSCCYPPYRKCVAGAVTLALYIRSWEKICSLRRTLQCLD
jgi:hypothetical protein